jgi:hypothetical protein
MEQEIELLRSQEYVSGIYPDPDESTLLVYSHTTLFKYILIISSNSVVVSSKYSLPFRSSV